MWAKFCMCFQNFIGNKLSCFQLFVKHLAFTTPWLFLFMIVDVIECSCKHCIMFTNYSYNLFNILRICQRLTFLSAEVMFIWECWWLSISSCQSWFPCCLCCINCFGAEINAGESATIDVVWVIIVGMSITAVMHKMVNAMMNLVVNLVVIGNDIAGLVIKMLDVNTMLYCFNNLFINNASYLTYICLSPMHENESVSWSMRCCR